MQMFDTWLWHWYWPVSGMPHISQHMIRKMNMRAWSDACSRLLQHGSLHGWSFAARSDIQFNYFLFVLLVGNINCSWKKGVTCLFCKPVRAETHSVPWSTSSLVSGDSEKGSADENEKGDLLCNWCGERMGTGLVQDKRSDWLHHFSSPIYRIALFLLFLPFLQWQPCCNMGKKGSLRKWPGHFSSIAVLLKVLLQAHMLPEARWF